MIFKVQNPNPGLLLVAQEEDRLERRLFSSFVFLRCTLSDSMPRHGCRASSGVFQTLAIGAFAIVRVVPSLDAPEKLDPATAVDILVKYVRRQKPKKSAVEEALKAIDAQTVLSDKVTLVLNNGDISIVLSLPGVERFVLASSFVACELKIRYVAIDSDSEKLIMDSALPELPLFGFDAESKLLRFASLFCFDHVCSSRALFGRLALIVGPPKSGKMALARQLVAQHHAEQCYSEFLDCASFVNEKLSHIRKVLENAFLRAASNAPTILVIQNLHFICPASGEEDDGSSLRPHQISQMLVSLIRSANFPLIIIAPSKAAESLHRSLVDLSVCYSPHTVVPPLSLETRRNICNQFSALPLSETVLDYCAELTEGFVAGDISILMQKLPQSLADCTRDAVLEARKSTVPQNLQGVKLHESRLCFADVGGLQQAKQTLVETLGWPSKHARLLQNAPIKLPSGILLYGPPGSGKTMLASASAQEFGLNYISVSGPELLSKYIGASEQGVRDLFQRAKQCRPSVIVFDEFDSLAPKRGQDSSGVTDRVVNQLLTQLDGVQSRQGVFILAVSSRPDLIDPALLRPGRLDRLVYIPLPERDERKEIFEISAQKLKLSSSALDLSSLTEATEKYSGADIQALLYNAQLLAVHEAIDHEGDEDKGKGEEESDFDASTTLRAHYADGTNLSRGDLSQLQNQYQTSASANASDDASGSNSKKKEDICVTELHLQAALADLRPSISEKDYKNYMSIYSVFRSNREADYKTGLDENQQKQTLK